MFSDQWFVFFSFIGKNGNWKASLTAYVMLVSYSASFREYGQRTGWRGDQVPRWGFSAASTDGKATERRGFERAEWVQNILLPWSPCCAFSLICRTQKELTHFSLQHVLGLIFFSCVFTLLEWIPDSRWFMAFKSSIKPKPHRAAGENIAVVNIF